MIAVVAQHEDASLRNRHGVVKPVAYLSETPVGRLKDVALLERFAVDVHNARVEVNVHCLAPGRDHALDDWAAEARLLRRVDDNNVSRVDAPVEEIAL